MGVDRGDFVLLQSPANAKRLLDSVSELDAGKGEERQLISRMAERRSADSGERFAVVADEQGDVS
jgi:hypothetical protein